MVLKRHQTGIVSEGELTQNYAILAPLASQGDGLLTRVEYVPVKAMSLPHWDTAGAAPPGSEPFAFLHLLHG